MKMESIGKRYAAVYFDEPIEQIVASVIHEISNGNLNPQSGVVVGKDGRVKNAILAKEDLPRFFKKEALIALEEDRSSS